MRNGPATRGKRIPHAFTTYCAKRTYDDAYLDAWKKMFGQKHSHQCGSECGNGFHVERFNVEGKRIDLKLLPSLDLKSGKVVGWTRQEIKASGLRAVKKWKANPKLRSNVRRLAREMAGSLTRVGLIRKLTPAELLKVYNKEMVKLYKPSKTKQIKPRFVFGKHIFKGPKAGSTTPISKAEQKEFVNKFFTGKANPTSKELAAVAERSKATLVRALKRGKAKR